MFIHNAAVQDELCALNAIYWESQATATYSDDDHTTISLNISSLDYNYLLRMPGDYPISPPEVLGVDDLVASLNHEIRRSVVYLAGCIQAVFHPYYPCLYDAIEEFQMLYAAFRAAQRQYADDDNCSRFESRKAVLVRELALRAQERLGTLSKDALLPLSPFDVVDCSSCLEPFFQIDTAVLTCKHSLCVECLDGEIGLQRQLIIC
jgi:hypothetical protein